TTDLYFYSVILGSVVLVCILCLFVDLVEGQTGENVTLTCKYDIKYYGALYVCWNRGDIPSRGCGNQLVSTDGYKVKEESRVSSRYQLTGRLDEGDVSLTILKLTEDDAGRYGCRVEIPGLFNDDKHHFDLTVRGKKQLVPSVFRHIFSLNIKTSDMKFDIFLQGSK
uniref:Ig-like domain-containing protein n=1 Tax=Stegastes partitus TaxID=144197 RepID=A0A3B5APL6_9TELE